MTIPGIQHDMLPVMITCFFTISHKGSISSGFQGVIFYNAKPAKDFFPEGLLF